MVGWFSILPFSHSPIRHSPFTHSPFAIHHSLIRHSLIRSFAIFKGDRMKPIDMLLILVGIVIVVFLAYQRMVRALFALGALWAATMMSGLLYEEAAYRIKAVAGNNPSLTEGLMFAGLLVIIFVVGYILICISFPETRLPKIGFLDVMMGFFLGIIVAAIFVALLQNAMGVMIRERWTDSASWRVWRSFFVGSSLRPFSRSLLSLWRQLFIPFFRTLPSALTPQ